MDFTQKYPFYSPPNPRFGAPRAKGMRFPGRLASAAGLILCFGILLTILNIYELHQIREDHNAHINPVVEAKAVGKYGTKQPVVWVNGKQLQTGYLKHVFAVFDRIGYVVGSGDSDWDVLWAHEYPFETLSKVLSDLRPHQKVNHFPGTGYITNKVSLATSVMPYIPKAFKIPSEKNKYLHYAKQNPEKLWVQKRNSHRGIKIKKIEELDLESDGSFIQEYVDKPFLIDGKKFDIGIYTILTSIDPLRVYIVDGEVLYRFCMHDYYPFDSKDSKKYVVGDDYLPIWEIPSLKKIYDDTVYTCRETIDRYLQQKGYDYKKMWADMKEAITMVYLQKEKFLISTAAKYKTTRNFFEMVRFDFVLDEKLNVYLMEVNMSPNLSSGHFARNKRIYEHVVFNLVSLVGITRPVTNAFEDSDIDEKDMQASDRDITVFPDWCSTKKCLLGCESEMCSMCHQCLTIELKKTLKYAHLEHINRGSCRRVFPQPMTHEVALKWNPATAAENYKTLNKRNKMIYMWFVGKCRLDPGWCY